MRFLVLYTATHFFTNRKQYAAIIVMMILSALLIGSVQFLRVATDSRMDACEDILAVESNRVLVAYTDGHRYAAVPKADIEGVSAFGTYCEDRFNVRNVSVNAVCVSKELQGMVRLSVVEGEMPSDEMEEQRYLLLGYNVGVAELGEHISWIDYSGKHCEGIVSGRLAPQSKWPETAESFWGKGSDTYIPLDDRVLCFTAETSDEMPDSAFVFITDTYDEEVKQRASLFLEQKGYHSVTAAYLSDIFSVADVENRSIVRLLSDTVWLTIFVTVIMMACLQTVTVLNHRRMLGIWYSSGVSRAQAVGVFAVAMILATIIALFIAGMVGLIWLRTFDKESAQSVRLIVRTRVVPHVIFSVVAMDLIGFLLPLHAVLNGKPARLMREFRT